MSDASVEDANVASCGYYQNEKANCIQDLVATIQGGREVDSAPKILYSA